MPRRRRRRARPRHVRAPATSSSTLGGGVQRGARRSARRHSSAVCISTSISSSRLMPRLSAPSRWPLSSSVFPRAASCATVQTLRLRRSRFGTRPEHAEDELRHQTEELRRTARAAGNAGADFIRSPHKRGGHLAPAREQVRLIAMRSSLQSKAGQCQSIRNERCSAAGVTGCTSR